MATENQTEPAISIGADGIDVHALEERILSAVADKRARGVYDDEVVARAERNNLLLLQDDAQFMDQYLQCLASIVPVDINDFEIVERHGALAPVLVKVKTAIWKLLKFYTYRLWSQQNQTNGVLLAAVELMQRRHRAEISELKERIEALEKLVKG